MPGVEGAEKKQEYFTKLQGLLDEYKQILICGADNVGSAHMQSIRKSLRAKAVLLMGKNTMIRKAIRMHLENNPHLEALLPVIKGNIGFVFVKHDLPGVRQEILKNRVGAPAKPGSFAPNDVVVPAGPTGMEPTQTSFLQALNIASKINKGQVEIINDVHLIKAGDRVGNSEAALLGKLNIKPFSYGLKLLHVYDNGNLYDQAVLDLTDDDLLAKFREGVNNIAAIGLAIGYPTIASLPHSVINGYNNLLALSIETKYSFPASEKIKAFLADPSAFAAAAPVAAAPAAASKAPAAPAKKVEVVVEEEDDGDMGLDLFG
jgi:large subunit ribosomal protein LP0